MGNSLIGSERTPQPSPEASDATSPTERPTSTDSMAVFSYLSQEIIASMGKDFLGKTPIDLMERYCLATVEANDATGPMLHQVVTNFMTAYTNPETRDEALKAFDYLTHLADK